MVDTLKSPREFLATVSPFERLAAPALDQLVTQIKPLRYRMGQTVLLRERMPGHLVVLWQGRLRLLGYDTTQPVPITLTRLEPGAMVGWLSLLRGVPCETAIAADESIALTLPEAAFWAWLEREPSLADYFRRQTTLLEVFDLIQAELQRHANSGAVLAQAGVAQRRELAAKLLPDVQVVTPQPQNGVLPLTPDRLWLVSSQTEGLELGSRFDLSQTGQMPAGLRLVGLPAAPFQVTETVADASADSAPSPTMGDIPYAPDLPPEGERRDRQDFPHVKGSGPLGAAMACLQMLAQHYGMPFRKDVLRRVLDQQLQRTDKLSMPVLGAVTEMMGLQTQLTNVPVAVISRVQTPALIEWQDSLAVLYATSDREIVLGVPEMGLLRQTPADFAQVWGDEGKLLMLQKTRETPQKKFGINWFWPALKKYRGVLLEVLIASFFVQLFGLANPLITQVIIDKVLVQNSPDTLTVLGSLLVGIAFAGAILTMLRTYLFADTTNRIDMSLGSQVINHLLRLPLRYFERRPVGELSTRVNELENIRQFLTGTALTVVLDAIFSVIYIGVMLIYSWVLTIVALVTLPLFMLLTLFVSPIVRRQLRQKAERNAQTQSHLVEILSGIQTVKAQNLELRSRWIWQERYARYVSAGFRTLQTSTAAGSASTFLNQLSSLLVLWVGAYLVLQGQLTLGELIAFRIIAGYVTSPLLRLTQLWQNFQETALSLERLADILDTPPEADERDRDNIPMPLIQGQVRYENVSFRFNPSGPLQLNNVSLEFPAGSFVGIVGQSGSGKSTLMKLLPRLYPLESGQILIDGYDIAKVELYSLRRQVGIVPQDTLLFEGTVQENISLNYPDASPEEIIEAAKVAVAHDFIMELPNGYNTRVGERGAALSGGQRQRIAIARTVLQNPNLLILDEATSALDYDSERQVCLNLAETFRDRTVFFITHRLSTIHHADAIMVMDQGSLVELGTHDELMAMRGRYYCLYKQQEAGGE